MEEKNQKKGLSFIVLNLMEGVLPMVLLAIVVTIVSGILLKNGVTEVEEDKLHAAALGLAEYFAYDVREYGEVVYDDYADHEYVEMLQCTGIELTLFKGDTRFMTSLRNADGSYNEGTKASPEVWAAVSKGEDYFAQNLTIGDKKYLVYYVPIYADETHKDIWGMAFAGTPMTTINELNSSLKINIVICSVLCIVVFGVIVFILAKRLSNALTVIASHIKMLASGNISQKKHVTSLCTEFAGVGESLDALQEELSDAIGAIYNTSKNLGEAVEKVDRLSGESAEGADQITNVIEQIATTAQTMAENVQEANSAMLKMSDSIENITKNSQMAAKKAERMKENNSEALKNMRNVNESNDRSVEAISNIAKQAESCNEAVEHIKNAADTIASIAGQTNLLALNASIEAARAGESGRGFAVVADNIRDLAEQSNKSAGEIAQSVHDVVSRVQECVDMAVSAKKLMEDQKNLVESVASGMEELGSEVNEVADGIDAVSSDARILDTEKDSVLQSITDLSAISEENAASAEEVTASVLDVASGIEGTKGESGQMKGMADQLSEKISFFS